MKNELDISIQDRDEIGIIEMTGDVTANTGQLIEDAYHGISEDGKMKIILAFAGVALYAAFLTLDFFPLASPGVCQAGAELDGIAVG